MYLRRGVIALDVGRGDQQGADYAVVMLGVVGEPVQQGEAAQAVAGQQYGLGLLGQVLVQRLYPVVQFGAVPIGLWDAAAAGLAGLPVALPVFGAGILPAWVQHYRRGGHGLRLSGWG